MESSINDNGLKHRFRILQIPYFNWKQYQEVFLIRENNL